MKRRHKKLTLSGFTSWSWLLDKGDQAETYKSKARAYQSVHIHVNFHCSLTQALSKIYDAQEHIRGCVCVCYKGLLLFPVSTPWQDTMRSFFSPFNACSFEFQVIGVEDSPTTRSGGRLFCYHVSSQTDVNLRKGEREREGERAGEREGERRRSGEMECSGGVWRGRRE